MYVSKYKVCQFNAIGVVHLMLLSLDGLGARGKEMSSATVAGNAGRYLF